jgi:hypothetical protein
MKIFIFAGRIHHWLKLKGVYDRLTNDGHDVLWMAAQNATNNDPATEYLVPSGDRFLHMYDWLTEPIESDPANLDVDYYDYIPPFWYAFSLREFNEIYQAASNLLDKEKPDIVMGLHENNAWVKPIAFLCHQKGIPHYVFQEGLLRRLDQETMRKQSSACTYSDGIFVWGESAKEQYLEAGIPEEKIHVSGPVHLDHWYNERKKITRNVTPIVAWFPPLLEHYKGDFIADTLALDAFCKDNSLGFIVKLHPFNKGALAGQVRTYDETDPMPLLPILNLAITQHSTIGIECLALGIPIIEFNVSNEPILQSWHNHGVAELISTNDEMDKIMKVLQGQSALDVDHLNQWTQHKMLSDGRAVERCLKVLYQ